MNAMADRIHADLPERPEVFAEKIQLFPEGCFVLAADTQIAGYGLSHPWMLDDIPPLDRFLGRIPAAADCLFIHDVVVLPEARGRRAGAALIDIFAALAKSRRLAVLALVSVYDTRALWEGFGFSPRIDPALADKLGSYGETARYMVRDLGLNVESAGRD
jgi:GNAT superfamily N-acetyltransferase